MRRALAAVVLALVATATASSALGASGSLSDPDDDTLADVLKLSYANKDAKAVVRMTYDGYRPMVENFYVKWGSEGKYYKLQRSSTNGTSLWYSNGTGESEKRCDGDRVRYDEGAAVSTGTVPRSCMPQAPARVKFQGVVTEGLFLSDATRTSRAIRKG